MMAHTHRHGRSHALGAKALGYAFLLNLLFTVVEAIGGLATDSVAVLSDAVHDLGDSLVLGTAWYLQRLSDRDRDQKYSYGYGRYSMLGGWMASMVLILGALFMLSMSIPRLWSPGEPHAPGMILLAVFGLVVNSLAAYLLRGGESLNERGVFLHLLEDVLGWAAVLIGAIIIHFTGARIIDPLLSIGISVFILYNAVRTLRQGTKILMQGLPEHFDTLAVSEALSTIPGVVDTHDQHAWSLDGEFIVLTIHLVVNETGWDAGERIKTEARRILHERGVDHATIELEPPMDAEGPFPS
ncbi:MAG: cation transporter [Flavobacteriales bacterium]|nr:cation transporter [Flavobacteriales bacterium]